MNRVNSKIWSEHDLQKLKDYAEDGASPYRTAAALNRTVAGVRSMAQRHGIRFVPAKSVGRTLSMSTAANSS